MKYPKTKKELKDIKSNLKNISKNFYEYLDECALTKKQRKTLMIHHDGLYSCCLEAMGEF